MSKQIPVVFAGVELAETWFLMYGQAHGLKIIENTEQRADEHIRTEDGWNNKRLGKFHTEELHNVYTSPDIRKSE
jgi:hypothetical protein